MRKLVVSGLIAAAAIGISASQASAYDQGYGSGYQQAQYGGGGWGGHSGDGWGGHARKECHWERKRVRVWNEYQRSYVWVWQRVQVCH